MRFTALTLETATGSATDAVEFAFLPKRPLPFRAGQGGLVIVPGGGAKLFTFASDNRAGRISIATAATQLADAGVPARMTRKGRFWGMRNAGPRHDLVPA